MGDEIHRLKMRVPKLEAKLAAAEARVRDLEAENAALQSVIDDRSALTAKADEIAARLVAGRDEETR